MEQKQYHIFLIYDPREQPFDRDALGNFVRAWNDISVQKRNGVYLHMAECSECREQLMQAELVICLTEDYSEGTVLMEKVLDEFPGDSTPQILTFCRRGEGRNSGGLPNALQGHYWTHYEHISEVKNQLCMQLLRTLGLPLEVQDGALELHGAPLLSLDDCWDIQQNPEIHRLCQDCQRLEADYQQALEDPDTTDQALEACRDSYLRAQKLRQQQAAAFFAVSQLLSRPDCSSRLRMEVQEKLRRGDIAGAAEVIREDVIEGELLKAQQDYENSLLQLEQEKLRRQCSAIQDLLMKAELLEMNLADSSRQEKVLAVYEKAVALEEKFRLPQTGKLRLIRYLMAQEAYEKALLPAKELTGKQDPEAWLLLAQVYQKMDRWEEAAQAYFQAFGLIREGSRTSRGADAEDFCQFLDGLAASEGWDSAIESGRSMYEKLDPSGEPACIIAMRVGGYYRQKEDFEAAGLWLQRAIDGLEPGHIYGDPARMVLGECFLCRGMPQRCIEITEPVLERQRQRRERTGAGDAAVLNEIGTAITLGRAHLDRGNRERAGEVFLDARRLLSLLPVTASSLHHRLTLDTLLSRAYPEQADRFLTEAEQAAEQLAARKFLWILEEAADGVFECLLAEAGLQRWEQVKRLGKVCMDLFSRRHSRSHHGLSNGFVQTCLEAVCRTQDWKWGEALAEYLENQARINHKMDFPEAELREAQCLHQAAVVWSGIHRKQKAVKRCEKAISLLRQGRINGEEQDSARNTELFSCYLDYIPWLPDTGKQYTQLRSLLEILPGLSVQQERAQELDRGLRALMLKIYTGQGCKNPGEKVQETIRGLCAPGK